MFFFLLIIGIENIENSPLIEELEKYSNPVKHCDT